MGITCFTAPTQCFQVFYMCTFQRCCARFRDVVLVSEMLCTFPGSCASFTEVVHVSQKLCTFHKLPNNVCVQLYTHGAHSNQQKHWGDQTRSPDIYIYIHTYIHTDRQTDRQTYIHTYIHTYKYRHTHTNLCIYCIYICMYVYELYVI